MGLASLFLSSASQKNADIKCLMLACTTDVQIKTSPVRHDFSSSSSFFFSLLAFLTIHLLFLLFPRSIQVLPFPPFLKVWIVFISRSLVFFFLFFSSSFSS